MLSSDIVQVWRLSFSRLAGRAEALTAVLDDRERARAARFRFAEDRRRCALSRAVLRHLLGSASAVAPQAIRFDYGAHGKPAMRGGALSFNVAHSGDVGLIALTQGRDVGVDVEQWRPEVATLAVAARYFAAEEMASLRAVPASRQAEAFFRCWTLKEAFIKARGLGLAQPLDRFVVELSPERPARLLSLDGDRAAATAWQLATLPAPPGYAAALAVAGGGWTLSLHDWPA